MKNALITGVTGQDGSYLADQLLDDGYTVFGVVRRSANPNHWRIRHIEDRLTLLDGDMTDGTALCHIVKRSEPDLIFNMAGQSFVPTSWSNPLSTFDINVLGVAKLLEAVREFAPQAHVVQASSSEIYGKVHEVPQNELTFPHPRSPYGVSKLAALWNAINYRESYNMFVCNSICFNHESPRRGEEFITRKISMAVAAISEWSGNVPLKLGNLDALRDWGYAPDYVRGMVAALRHDRPDDYIFATGVCHSVREFVARAFAVVDIEVEWVGKGKDERGIDKRTKDTLVVVDPQYIRPAEVDILRGDASKARCVLGWESTTSFDELVRIMVEADVERLA